MDLDYGNSNVGPWKTTVFEGKQDESSSEITGLDLEALEVASQTSESTSDRSDLASVASTSSTGLHETVDTAQGSEERRRTSTFFDLPFEIRREIYSWVHLASPVQQGQLAPWYPTPTYSAYFLQAVIPGLIVTRTAERPSTMHVIQGSEVPTDRDPPTEARLLSPFRPLSRVPTSLLRTCKQVYTEARCIPFHENEFVFVNWFSSGLSAARAFTKGLQPWQRSSMRYVRLELQGSDLAGDRLREWGQVCEFWADQLRGLRLKILLDGRAFIPHFGASYMDHGDPELDAEKLVGDNDEWIRDGLRRLMALKHLEIELVDSQWSNDQKVEWCNDLSRKLNAGREEMDQATVLCVEKATKKAYEDAKASESSSSK